MDKVKKTIQLYARVFNLNSKDREKYPWGLHVIFDQKVVKKYGILAGQYVEVNLSPPAICFKIVKDGDIRINSYSTKGRMAFAYMDYPQELLQRLARYQGTIPIKATVKDSGFIMINIQEIFNRELPVQKTVITGNEPLPDFNR